MIIHVVLAGETVNTIAEKYGVPVSRIIADNELKPPFPLAVGQTLVILFPDVTHTVAEGETASSIATQYGTTVRQLYRNNPALNKTGEVFVGQTIIISYNEQKLGSIFVNGYAYPFIDKALLNRTLSFLTYLIPFTYGMTPEGGLIELDDYALISAAKKYGTGLLMHLSTLTKEEVFSNELASQILNNPAAQDILIANIIKNMTAKGYNGLDIDFEYLYPKDAQAYVDFVAKTTKALNANGFQVIVALAPKISDDQKGQLYEGHMYKGLGQAANYAFLMTYEWGYLYGPPLAVAPLDKVRAVVEYAVTVIEPSKLILGIPNYGYDWPLPFVMGKTVATPISNVEGIDIAIKNNVTIEFDEAAAAPFYYYTDSKNVQHKVWFEDARSIRAKLNLVTEFGLKGIGYWSLMKPFPQNWMLINSLYNITAI